MNRFNNPAPATKRKLSDPRKAKHKINVNVEANVTTHYDITSEELRVKEPPNYRARNHFKQRAQSMHTKHLD